MSLGLALVSAGVTGLILAISVRRSFKQGN